MNHHITAMTQTEFTFYIACSCGELLVTDVLTRFVLSAWKQHCELD